MRFLRIFFRLRFLLSTTTTYISFSSFNISAAYLIFCPPGDVKFLRFLGFDRHAKTAVGCENNVEI